MSGEGDYGNKSVVLAYCALAAEAWCNKHVPRKEAVQKLMWASGWLIRKEHVRQGAGELAATLDLFEQGTGTWLPEATDEPLIERFGSVTEPSGYCKDIIEELGQRPEMEWAQRLVGESRERFKAKYPEREAVKAYQAFRLALIEKPVPGKVEAHKTALQPDFNPGDLYEELPATVKLSREGVLVVYPCPRCRWAMYRRGDKLTCDSSVCVSAGALYYVGAGAELVPLGMHGVPEPLEAEGRLRLKRGVWRYTVLPGLLGARSRSSAKAAQGRGGGAVARPRCLRSPRRLR